MATSTVFSTVSRTPDSGARSPPNKTRPLVEPSPALVDSSLHDQDSSSDFVADFRQSYMAAGLSEAAVDMALQTR